MPGPPRALAVTTLALATAALFAATLEFARNPDLHRVPWSQTGLWRLAGYAAACTALAILRRPVLWAAAAVLYGAGAIGIGPFAAAAFSCAGAAATGSLILGKARADSLLELPIAFCLGEGLLGTAASLLGWTHACAPAILIALTAAPIALRRAWLLDRLLALPRPRASAGLAALSFALGIQFLLVLKPEMGTDALAMHLALPMYVARHHYFSYDVREFLWAVMPQTADWWYAVAFAARLANLANLLAVIALLYGLARRYATTAAALAACALLATAPLVQTVTGSLFIDNFLAAMLLASYTSFWLCREHGGSRWFVAGCLGMALALATKAGALAFVPGILALAGSAARRGGIPLRTCALAAAAVLPVALYWYSVAWLQTGNPLFPYANELFHSPLLDRARVAPQFHEPIGWRTPAAITFHSGRFIEGTDGAAGFQYFLFLAPSILALAWTRAAAPAWAAAIGLSAFVLSFSQVSYLRYVYPELAILMLPLAAWAGRLGRPVYALMALAAIGNVLFQPAAGWYHRDFLWNDLAEAGARDAYLRQAAPARIMIGMLNRMAPGEPALFCGLDHIAGFFGDAYTTNWHGYLRQEGLANLREAPAVLEWVNRRKIRYILSPEPAALDTWPRVLPAFFDDFTEPLAAMGGWVLYRVRPDAGRAAPPPPASGAWDDADIRVALRGSWYRDFTCPDAFRRTLTRSARAGDEIEFPFQATRIAFVYARDPAGGAAELWVDGQRHTLVDQHAAAPEFGLRQEIDGLPAGRHRLTVRVIRGTVNADGFVL